MEESILHFFKMAIPFADHIRRFTRKTTLPFFLIYREGRGGDKSLFLTGEIFPQAYQRYDTMHRLEICLFNIFWFDLSSLKFLRELPTSWWTCDLDKTFPSSYKLVGGEIFQMLCN